MSGGLGNLVLRMVHILAGSFWVGAGLFLAGFLMPALRAVGPAGAPVMQQIGQARRLPAYMMSAAILTVLSGIGLYWRDSDGFRSAAWLGSGAGMTFGTGGAIAIVTVILGMTINSPTGRRLGALAGEMQQAGGPPAPEKLAEMLRLQVRMGKATLFAAVLLTIATSLMAIARYVP